MEVRYTLTLRDYIAFLLNRIRKSGVGRGWYFFWWALLPLLCVSGIVWAFQLDDDNAHPFAGILALTGIFFAIIYPPVYRASLERNLRAYAKKMGTQGITGPITLVLTEELFVEITEAIRSETRWETMKGMEEVGDYTYIFVTGALTAILPRSGFDTDEAYHAVRDFVRRKLADRVQNLTERESP
ncbi:MAG TPA: YcxB family protein [Gemmata sp.]